jgi:hypothetical protein
MQQIGAEHGVEAEQHVSSGYLRVRELHLWVLRYPLIQGSFARDRKNARGFNARKRRPFRRRETALVLGHGRRVRPRFNEALL